MQNWKTRLARGSGGQWRGRRERRRPLGGERDEVRARLGGEIRAREEGEQAEDGRDKEYCTIMLRKGHYVFA